MYARTVRIQLKPNSVAELVAPQLTVVPAPPLNQALERM